LNKALTGMQASSASENIMKVIQNELNAPQCEALLIAVIKA